MKYHRQSQGVGPDRCRSPHGERGLKYERLFRTGVEARSLSSWRAWIEISTGTPLTGYSLSRSPHGERGLKLIVALVVLMGLSRSPHGERGLKLMREWLEPPDVGRSPHGERGLK